MKEIDNANSVSKTVTLRSFLLLHGTLLLYAMVSAFAKLAGNHLAAEDFTPAVIFLILEVLALGLYSILWQQVLKRMPLHFAFANKGICTLWTALIGILFFAEKLTTGKVIGLCVVLFGVVLVVTDRE